MIARPILFSGPMVRAILEGRKTQTRRVIRLPGFSDDGGGDLYQTRDGDVVPVVDLCPYGRPGDLLWVRETWGVARFDPGAVMIEYLADNACRLLPTTQAFEPDGRVRPSIHMPRWASRLTLRLTDVRVQRVQEITTGDALAEGCKYCGDYSPEEMFAQLWDSLNAKRGYPWDSNSWVWALGFELAR